MPKKPKAVRYWTKDIAASAESGYWIGRTVSVQVETQSVKKYYSTVSLTSKLGRCARLILDFCVENMNEKNKVVNDNDFKKKFNRLLKNAEQKPYGAGTINKAFVELADNLLVSSSKTKGVYTVDPLFFFAGEEEERIKLIRAKYEKPHKAPLDVIRKNYWKRLKSSEKSEKD